MSTSPDSPTSSTFRPPLSGAISDPALTRSVAPHAGRALPKPAGLETAPVQGIPAAPAETCDRAAGGQVVRDGEVVEMMGGTTATEVVRALADRRDLTG